MGVRSFFVFGVGNVALEFDRAGSPECFSAGADVYRPLQSSKPQPDARHHGLVSADGYKIRF